MAAKDYTPWYVAGGLVLVLLVVGAIVWATKGSSSGSKTLGGWVADILGGTWGDSIGGALDGFLVNLPDLSKSPPDDQRERDE